MEIKKMITTDSDNKRSQYYPQTHLDAIVGFGETKKFNQKGKTFTDKLNNEFLDRAVNVKSFGAVGDRYNDDTQAIKSAIEYASNNGCPVYFPAGKYVITETIRIDYMHLYGAGNAKTFIMPKGINVALIMGNQNHVHDIAIYTTINGKDIVAFQMGDIDLASSGNSLDKVVVRGDIQYDTTGILLTTGNSKNTTVIGSWTNNLGNIELFDVNDGIRLHAQDWGFVNGNRFDNITIHGYKHTGIWLSGTSYNSQHISQNRFTDIQIESLSYTKSTSRGILLNYGFNNLFDYVHTWIDGKGSAPSLEIQPVANISAAFDIRENRFTNSFLESNIIGDEDAINYNSFFDNRMNDWQGSKFSRDVWRLLGRSDSVAENQLASNVIDVFADPTRTNGLGFSNSNYVTGVDSQGSYIDVIGDNGNIFLPIPKLNNRIKGIGKLTVGVDFELFTGNDSVSITPSFFYYNPTNNKKFAMPRIVRQASQSRTGTYRFYSAINNDVKTVPADYTDAYISVFFSGAQTKVRIRKLMLIPNFTSISTTLTESHIAEPTRILSNKEVPASLSDVGLYQMGKEYNSGVKEFDPGILTTKKTSSGKYIHEYPFYQ